MQEVPPPRVVSVRKTGLAVRLATCGPLGFAPWAPGTCGSLLGVLLVFALRGADSAHVETAAIVAFFLVGVWSSTLAEKHFAYRDPPFIVVDELVGTGITLWTVPLTPAAVVLGFALFRFLDFIKPFPADRAEGLPAGLGIMSDDAVAALYANGMLHVAGVLLPTWFR